MNVALLEEKYLTGETIQRLICSLPAISSVRRIPDATLAAFFCEPDFPDIVFADYSLFLELESNEKAMVERMKRTCGIVVYSPVDSEAIRSAAYQKGADIFVRIGDMTVMMESIFSQVVRAMISKKIKRQTDQTEY